jgi:hypothetical protein
MINYVKINNVSVNFKYGLTIKEVLNKDLNTGILVIPQTTRLTLEAMDRVEISVEYLNFMYFLIGSYTEKIINFEGAKSYSYEIMLVSPTLQLQRIVLPNRSITRKISSDTSLSIYAYVFRLLSMYAPDFTLSSTFINTTTSVQCPEMSWSRPTLFEVINDLLITIGYVVTLNNYTQLSLLDLSGSSVPVNENYVNNYEISQNVAEYANALEIEAQNVYTDNSMTSSVNTLSVRTSQGIKMTTENQEIFVQKPIFTIEKVEVIFRNINIGVESSKYITLDITDRVIPKNVYDLLFSSNSTGYIQDSGNTKYRRNYIYFEPNNNYIRGLDFREDNWTTAIPSERAIVHVIKWALESAYPLETSANINDQAERFNSRLHVADDEGILFNISYTTTDNIKFRIRKEIPLKNKSTLINNQESSHVYAKALGKQQQEFINRIGNKEMSITGKTETYSQIPTLKNTIENFVLVEREYSIFEDYYIFKALLTEHYSKENMFAGINTRKRYTELSQESDAFISNHITEEYYRFGFTNTVGDNESFSGYIINNFGKKDFNLQGAVTTTRKRTPFADEEIGTFLLEVTPYIFGNSIAISLRMQDNYNVAYSLSDEALAFGGQTKKLVPYTDSNGNFRDISISLYRKGGIKEEAINPANLNNFSTSRNFQEAMWNSWKQPKLESTRRYFTNETNFVDYNPLVSGSKVFDSGYMLRHKDNREITSETIQFHVFGSDNIIIVDKFFDYLPIFYNNISDATFKFAYSTTATYEKGDTSYKGNLITTTFSLFRNGNTLGIINNGSGLDFNTFTSWAVLNFSNELLIGVNNNGNARIFLNKE